MQRLIVPPPELRMRPAGNSNYFSRRGEMEWGECGRLSSFLQGRFCRKGVWVQCGRHTAKLWPHLGKGGKGERGRLLRGEMQFPSFLSRLFPGAWVGQWRQFHITVSLYIWTLYETVWISCGCLVRVFLHCMVQSTMNPPGGPCHCQFHETLPWQGNELLHLQCAEEGGANWREGRDNICIIAEERGRFNCSQLKGGKCLYLILFLLFTWRYIFLLLWYYLTCKKEKDLWWL